MKFAYSDNVIFCVTVLQKLSFLLQFTDNAYCKQVGSYRLRFLRSVSENFAARECSA